MAYPNYAYPGYQPAPYYPSPVPDQLAQLRQNQVQPMMQGAQMAQQPQPMQTNMGPVAPTGGPQNGGIIWFITC